LPILYNHQGSNLREIFPADAQGASAEDLLGFPVFHEHVKIAQVVIEFTERTRQKKSPIRVMVEKLVNMLDIRDNRFSDEQVTQTCL
jgi:hypothetical protein